MLLGVKNEVAIASKSKSIAASIKYIFDDEEIIFDGLRMVDGEQITFELLDTDDVTKAKALLKKELEGTVVMEDGLKFSVAMTEAEVERTKQNAIQQAVDTIRNRLNEFGLAEPTVAKQGEDKILVEVPGIKTQEDEQRIREIVGVHCERAGEHGYGHAGQRAGHVAADEDGLGTRWLRGVVHVWIVYECLRAVQSRDCCCGVPASNARKTCASL